MSEPIKLPPDMLAATLLTLGANKHAARDVEQWVNEKMRLAAEQATADIAQEATALMHECADLRAELAAMTKRATDAEANRDELGRSALSLLDRAEKAEDERDELRAELARLTTLRPFPTGREPALYWGKHDGEWVLNPLYVPSTHWTPLPDVKKPK